jgi:hypothetical protein
MGAWVVSRQSKVDGTQVGEDHMESAPPRRF